MACLTGLGSGRVQSTAGAALTMTALWQVYLRWSCLMYAHPLLLSPVLSHPPSLSFIMPSFPVSFLSPPCHSPLPWPLCLLPFSLFYYQPFCPLISGTDCDLLPPVCLLTGFCTQRPSNSSFLSIHNIFAAFFPVWSCSKFPPRKWLNSLPFNIYI